MGPHGAAHRAAGGRTAAWPWRRLCARMHGGVAAAPGTHLLLLLLPSHPQEERYKEIAEEMRHTLVRVGWKDSFVAKSVPVIPISGWMGDNLIKESPNMGWWKGVEVENREWPRCCAGAALALQWAAARRAQHAVAVAAVAAAAAAAVGPQLSACAPPPAAA